MPVEFLTDEQVAEYGRFARPPSRSELERFFLLNDRDRELVKQRRRPHNRLGFAIQLGTVRFLGTFLPNPLDLPTEVLVYQAGQLGLDASGLRAYAEREMTPLERDRKGRIVCCRFSSSARQASSSSSSGGGASSRTAARATRAFTPSLRSNELGIRQAAPSQGLAPSATGSRPEPGA
jgi:hypothetical protein